MTQTQDTAYTSHSVPIQNALCRFCASFVTWPIEKSKLIFQAQGLPILSRLISLPLRHHLQGAVASCTQRGGSGFLMFFIQGHLNGFTSESTSYKPVNEAIAGGMAGLVSAPFHTYWELMKVQIGKPVTIQAYKTALFPMIMRHSVFDGTFFFVNDVLSGYSSAVKFGTAAATASFCNLVFDVWKTQRMHRFPQKTSFWFMLSSLRLSTFASNYLVKGVDLSVNWYIVGLIKDACYPPHVPM